MDNSLGSIIESAKSILVLLPSKPYFDQVAAGLAIYLTLSGKKETSIVCPSPMLVESSRLVGVNKIESQLGNKNLNIRFSDYKADNIEKVSCNVEEGQIVLLVVPKPGFSSPTKEHVQMSYSGIAADTVILIGGAAENHFPAISLPDLAQAKIIHIGTRVLADGGKRGILSFARPASSTSELVANLMIESGLGLDPDIATNLLMGIEEATRGLKGPDVTADTFETIANLLRAGGKRMPQEPLDRNAFPPGSIPGEVPTDTGKAEEKPLFTAAEEKPPEDWLQPKIYKGTSIS